MQEIVSNHYCLCCLSGDAELLAAATAVESETLVENSSLLNTNQPIGSNSSCTTGSASAASNDEQC
jgi:hypothetical protein